MSLALTSNAPAALAAPVATAAWSGPPRPMPLALPHPEWIDHTLSINGPADVLAGFAAAAEGAGVVPWHYDYDQLEETWFLLMMAPPSGARVHRRTISLEGARVLARQLRDQIWELHETAIGQVGRSRACPFDLHSLLPVPLEMLRLGPDHPDALAWLWAHWGTTWPLRRVVRLPRPRQPTPAGEDVSQLGFWSADWTPWPAIRHIGARWPALRFAVTPRYRDS